MTIGSFLFETKIFYLNEFENSTKPLSETSNTVLSSNLVEISNTPSSTLPTNTKDKSVEGVLDKDRTYKRCVTSLAFFDVTNPQKNTDGMQAVQSLYKNMTP